MINSLNILLSNAANFSVNISMSPQTVEGLKKSGSQLYGFKVVKALVKGGVPLVWFVTKDYLVNTTVEWSQDYHAYISTQLNPSPPDIIKSCPLRKTTDDMSKTNSFIEQRFAATSCSSERVKLGEKMVVDEFGNTTVDKSDDNNVISIVNKATTPWTCGISQALLNPVAFKPISAFPLYGQHNINITPLNKVILMFASSSPSIETGAVVLKSWADSILIDLMDMESRNVTYDLNTGWSPTEQIWTKYIPNNSDITQLTIEN